MRAIILAICTTVLFNGYGPSHADDRQPTVINPASRLGVTPYQANKWGVVAVRLQNPTDQDTRILVSTFADKARTNQFGREFWVPANSRRTSWQSIFMPKTRSDSDRRIAVDSIVAERKNGDENFLKTASGAVTHDGVLTYSGNTSPTAIIVDMPESQNEIRSDSDSEVAISAVHACQFRRQHRRSVLEMSQRFLPPVTVAWDGVRHVILIGDRLGRCRRDDGPQALADARRSIVGNGRPRPAGDH